MKGLEIVGLGFNDLGHREPNGKIWNITWKLLLVRGAVEL